MHGGRSNRAEIELYARDAAGNVVTAGPAILASRAGNNGHSMPCRCGLETVKPTVHPNVTYCL